MRENLKFREEVITGRKGAMDEAFLLEEGLRLEETNTDPREIQTFYILFIQSCGEQSVKLQVSSKSY